MALYLRNPFLVNIIQSKGVRNEQVSKNIGTHCDRYWVHVFWVFHDLYFLFSVLLPVRIYYAKNYQFYQINHSSIYFFLHIMLKK
jgi:hypothetical protein